MIIEKTKNNQVTIYGKIVSGFQFSHGAYGKKYFMVNVDICRLSGNVDCIPVMVSEESSVSMQPGNSGLTIGMTEIRDI